MPTCLFIDFDGTLTRRDSTGMLLLSLLEGRPLRFAPLLPELLRMLRARGRDAEALQAAKCRAVGLLIRGRTEAELQPALSRFARRVSGIWRKDVLEKLRAEPQAGRRILIVTAAPDFAVRAALGADAPEVVGTRFEQQDGRYTGLPASPPCFGEEKPRRVEARLREEGLDWPEDSEGWADSPSDQPLMNRCTRQVWVAAVPR